MSKSLNRNHATNVIKCVLSKSGTKTALEKLHSLPEQDAVCLLTLWDLGFTVNHDAVKASWATLTQRLAQKEVERALATRQRQLSQNFSAFLEDLYRLGVTLQPTRDMGGNTTRTIDHFDTDKILGRGDFTAPGFNG